MAKVRVSLKGCQKIYENALKLGDGEVQQAMEKSVATLSGVYLRTAKKNTPVGKKIVRKDPKTGKVYRSNSEHMRRSWDVGEVEKKALGYSQQVFNSASYASYVNDGHRQRPGRYVPLLGKSLVASWVDGLNITEKAQKAVREASQKVIKRNLHAVEKRLFK